MGNCMERSKQGQEVETKQEEQENEEEKGGFVKESGFENGGIRIKLVLTKDELEWLMIQLKGKKGKSLEEVLGEIEKGRGKTDQGWKPSLESIMESPEVVEMDR